MIRRTIEQWLAPFDQHKVSGLTQTEFAKTARHWPDLYQLKFIGVVGGRNKISDAVASL